MTTPYGDSPEDKGHERGRRRIRSNANSGEQAERPVRPEGRVIHSETGIQYHRPHLVPREFFLIMATLLGCILIIYILLRGNLTGEARSRLLEIERNVFHLITHQILGRPTSPPTPTSSPTPVQNNQPRSPQVP